MTQDEIIEMANQAGFADNVAEKRNGLTEQQIKILLSDSKCWIGDDCSMPNLNYIIRAVEKAHGIGEK